MKRRTRNILIGYGIVLIGFGLCWPRLYREALSRETHQAGTGDAGAVNSLMVGSIYALLAMGIHLAILFRQVAARLYRLVFVGSVLWWGYLGIGLIREFVVSPTVLGGLWVSFTVAVWGLSFWRTKASAWIFRIIVAGISGYSLPGLIMVTWDNPQNENAFAAVLMAYCASNLATCLPWVAARHLNRLGLIIHQTWFFYFLFLLIHQGSTDGELPEIYGWALLAGSCFAMYCFRMYELRVQFDPMRKPGHTSAAIPAG